ncbi:hypothetical protein HC928_25975, partial [bacterium]|nr:hypothetical protein [bacterium]
LYYTFFLPGILAYELVYWLAAGVLNVRADRAIALPEKQEVGELRLTFVKLSKKAPAYKVNLIKAAPLITGVIAIWWITTYVIDVSAALQQASAGTFDAIISALNTLLATPDFWLWAYVGFTLGNTMMPDVTVLKIWRWLIWPTLGVVIILFALGLGDDIVGSALAGRSLMR